MRTVGTKTFDAVGAGRVFRCLLDATAQPGKLFALPPFEIGALESLAMTLLDHEVTFCAVGDDEAEERLAGATGARVAALGEADFAIVLGPGGAAAEMRRGTLERPEEGATAIYTVERLSNAGPLAIVLSGPGVPGERRLGVSGLPASEVEALRWAREEYPLGVDAYLVDEAGQVAGLPRSARLGVAR